MNQRLDDSGEETGIAFLNPTEMARRINDVEDRQEGLALAEDVGASIANIEFSMSENGGGPEETKKLWRHIFACGYLLGCAESHEIDVEELIEELGVQGYLKRVKRE